MQERPPASAAMQGGIDSELLRLISSTALQTKLDTIVGPKTLILTPSLAGPLGLVTEVGLLKNNHAVTKMFWLEPGPLSQAERNVVYLCRPEAKFMRIIAGQSVSHVVKFPGRVPSQLRSFTRPKSPANGARGEEEMAPAGVSRPAGSSVGKGPASTWPPHSEVNSNHGYVHASAACKLALKCPCHDTKTDQIRTTPDSSQHRYHLLVVPRMTSLCTSVLSDLGVLGSLEIQELQLGLIPLENDVLSLEYEDVWRKTELDGDPSAIYDLAKSIMTLQRAFGPIPRIIGKGDSARRLVDLLRRFRTEQPSSVAHGAPLANGVIDSMLVIDRQVDMVSALCTQLTYEGLVDEVVGIKHSHIDVDPDLLNPPPPASTSTPTQASMNLPTPRKRKHLLSSSTDQLFADLRDQNFAVVGSVLNRTARRLNEDYEKRHQAKTAAELRQFVGQLGGLQSEHQALRLHTNLTEQVMNLTRTDAFNIALEVQQNLIAGVDLATQENSIRELINLEAPLRTVLRLLCMYSLITGGIKQKVLEEFERDVLQTYGFDYLPLLIALEQVHVLVRAPPTSRSTPKPAFAQCRKPLRLIVDDVDEQNPQDPSYVFSGYAPLSVRLVQTALAPAGASTNGIGGKGPAANLNGWRGVEEVVKLLPGATFDERQKIDDAAMQRLTGGELPTTIVCFIGGVTFAEISALRLVNRQLPTRNLLVVTTDTVTGSSLLSSLTPEHLRRSATSVGASSS